MSMKEIIKELGLENFDFKVESCSGGEFDFTIEKINNKVLIKHRRLCDLYRSLGLLKINKNKNFKISQKCGFENLGYLIDTARNAVPKLTTLKKQALNLALLGYNQIYLYLEDLIEVEKEPYFGYLRGRYSVNEIKEFDEYCKSLGIELVPAIQTLAHLNSIFKWPEYSSINDVADILLVGKERTYELLNHYFDTICKCFSSNKIHIGMDEAHLVGRGRYLNEHGYQNGFDVMLAHLQEVVKINEKYGKTLQMWSDMFFRLSFDGAYYSKDKQLKEEIVRKIPKDINQFYWDYETDNLKILNNMFLNHKKISDNIYFAAGAWKWNGWNPSNMFSIHNLSKQVSSCIKNGVNNFLLTGWSDDGAEASIFSTLPSLIFLAEAAYNGDTSKSNLNLISESLFGFNFNNFLESDLLIVKKEQEVCGYSYLNYSNLAKILLYNDPLSGAYDGVIYNRFSFNEYSKLKRKMNRYAKQSESFKTYFSLLGCLCSVLELKANLGLRIRDAYQRKKKEQLLEIAKKDIPTLVKRLKSLSEVSYKQWMNENKSNGYEVIANRLGGLIGRLKVVKRLIEDYCFGVSVSIEELEQPLNVMSDEDALGFLLWTTYYKISSIYVH